MGDRCADGRGVVEEVGGLFEGDSLPHWEPIFVRGCPPSKRKSKRCEMVADFGTVTSALGDGLKGNVSTLIDDDGVFTMSSQFQKDAEMEKQKRLIANTGLVAQTLTNDSLPPVGPVSPVKKEIEKSSFCICGEEGEIGLQPSGFCMQKTERECFFSSLTEPTSWKQPSLEEFRKEYGAVGGGYFFDSNYCINSATRPTRNPKPLRSQRHLHSPTLDDETADIFEDVDDFIPGSPLKRDLRLPAPQYARQPPKSSKRQVRLCAFSSIQIPNSSVPGITVEGTVDSSLAMHGSPVAVQRDGNSPLPNLSTTALHDGGVTKEPKKLPSESTPSKHLTPLGIYPFLSSSGTFSFFWYSDEYYGDTFEA
ncbi:hypothetical protein MOQ_004363 [Trypanosoma cruzi marinkellei]|uniref:Uncharacterized protein n=1 Tax=Trypanosoma cruzi marinkellei TaxID=85056 RepID=K2NS21_TRYCR|nr:hypothetical protein MOQ_004363 [Trypanosoma cruzi marinkellei]